jgi:outer membrane protein assembly factor BamB
MASVSAPVTGRGLVVVAGTRDCNDRHLSVVAMNAKTGQPAWQRTVAAENPCSFGPLLRLAGDVVVVGGPDPDVGGGVAQPGNACDHPVAAGSAATGLNLATGGPRWQAPAAAGRVLAASVGTVIADSASPGCLVSLDPATGQIRWTVAPPVIPFGLDIGGNIAVGQGGDGPSLAAIGLDCGTGKTRWKTAVPEGDNAGPLEVGDAAVVATSQQGPNIRLTALATATGRQLWHDSVQAYQIWTTIGPGMCSSPGSATSTMPPSKAAIRAPVFAAGSPVTSVASGARSPMAQQSSATHNGTRGASAPPTAISFGRCPAHTKPRRSPPTPSTSRNPSPRKTHPAVAADLTAARTGSETVLGVRGVSAELPLLRGEAEF